VIFVSVNCSAQLDFTTPLKSWWQPVRLVGVDLAGDALRHVTLGFTSPAYAGIFAEANGERMCAGLLTVRAD
jgi:hypothetical protein